MTNQKVAKVSYKTARLPETSTFRVFVVISCCGSDCTDISKFSNLNLLLPTYSAISFVADISEKDIRF